VVDHREFTVVAIDEPILPRLSTIALVLSQLSSLSLF
jgi:hypothetical protein